MSHRADRSRGWQSVARFILALGFVVGSGSAVQAQDVVTVQTQHAELRLLPATQGLNAAGEATVGLEFTLDPGWHIYWRSPADAGLPPMVDWQGSANLADSSMQWPRPTRYELLGFQTLAYSSHVIFPVTLQATDPSAPLAAIAEIDFLICADICIPDSATVTLDLPPGGTGATDYAHEINRYAAAVPAGPEQAGLHIADIDVAAQGDTGTLSVAVAAAEPMTDVDLFVEADQAFVFDPPQITVAADQLSAQIAVAVQSFGADAATLADGPLTLTVVADNRAMEQSLVPAAFSPDLSNTTTAGSVAPAPTTGPGIGGGVGTGNFIGILAIAVLGGLILNLMPCVLPVLSLKVLSVVGHGGGDRRAVRSSFLASAAGILTAFMVLAAAAIGFRAAGFAVGWGMQFQQPIFLVVMLLIVALFGYSLLGLFEIRLPGSVADLAAKAGGPGPSKTLRSHFLTGAFATLLATPCTAPFVGTALGFALSRGSGEILAIFAAMGVGLALPYLSIALFPRVATFLPKPGGWMLWLTRIMGFALIGTAVWLLSVLASQIGWEQTMGVAALVALVAVVFLVRKYVPAARIAQKAGYATAVLVIAAVVAVAIAPQVSQAERSDDGLDWVDFDRAAIPGLVAEGRTVFVDVTADWCLTCIYNKEAVLEQDTVRAVLNDGDSVVAMLADWTNPDPAIADYLASFGRYGIPFNAVYGPGAPDGVALPELLTESIVLDAIAAVSNPDGSAVAAR